MGNNNQYSYCNVIGDTDVGCQRKANEDWYAHFESPNGLVSVVCDGMGGHVGGAVASHLAVETIQSFLEANYYDDPRKAIVEACNAANAAILQRTVQQPELTGMGSTCVMLIVRDGKVYVGCVGDSRIYLVRSKTIRQLTKDQSYVQMLVDEGAITKEQAERHPRKNEITNALGLPSMKPATISPDAFTPEAGDCFLMCSDGLSGMVNDHEIMKVVSNQKEMTQRERVAELIHRARRYGGHDNITCVIVEFPISPDNGKTDKPSKERFLVRFTLPCVAATLLLAIGGYALWRHYHKQPAFNPEKKEPQSVSVNLNDTIQWREGSAVLEFFIGDETNQPYLSFVNKSNAQVKYPIGRRHIAKDSVMALPSENLDKEITENTLSFTFNNKPFNGQCIIVGYKCGDTVFSYVIAVHSPLVFPQDSKVVCETSETNAKDDPSSLVKNLMAAFENSKADKEGQHLEQGTVTVSASGEKIIRLISSERESRNDTLYTSWGIRVGSADGGWYSYNCQHGDECVITIKTDSVPNNAKIEIPLNVKEEDVEKQYTIFVNRQ